MWVIYRRSDRQAVGSTVDAGVKLSKEQALEDVVGGLIGSPAIAEFDAVEVETPEEQEILMRTMGSGRTRLTDRGDGSLRVEDNLPEDAAIQVTTNATDFHPVDGVPLLPGDGESFLVVTLTKLVSTGDTSLVSGGEGAARAPIGGEEEKGPDDVIWLRPSHGSIREDNDVTRQEIRSVTLVNGTARFRFYSDAAKRLANVQMLSANPSLQLGGLQVEFI
jgi:hypothetical protein